MRVFSGLVLGAAFAGQVAAQDQCVHADLINQMADYVIQSDTSLIHRLGTRLAYFKMHYGDLAGEEVEAMFARLDQIEARGREELRDTYMLSQQGGLAAWQPDVGDVEERFKRIAPSTLRALILADEGDTYLALWAATLPEEDQRRPFYQYDARPAIYLTDQPDDVRLRIATKAEAVGAIHFAAALLAGHSDQSLFDAILIRHADTFDTGTLPPAWQFARYARIVQDRLASDATLENPFAAVIGPEYGVERTAALTYPVSFLYIYHSQAGNRDGTYLAVDAITDALPTFAPLTDPEAVWVATYRALLAYSPPDQVRDVLRGIGWDHLRFWTGESEMLGQLDIMVAKDLLGPFVRGETDGLPDIPDVTSIDWDTWVAAARVVRNGGPDPEQGRAALIELLWEAGRYDDAWSVVTSEPTSHREARDLASRLDMACDQRSILSTLEGRTGREFLIHFP